MSDELKRLIGVITNKRDKAIFVLSYRYGLRASEVNPYSFGGTVGARACELWLNCDRK
jgi:hypothetical protein